MSDTAKVDFLYLSEPDVIAAGVLDGKECVDVVGEVLELCYKGDYLMGGDNHNEHGIMLDFLENPPFPGMPKKGPDRRYMAMPAYLGGRFHMCGQKWYGSNKANNALGLPRSILMTTLNDTETGAPVAYMSGNLISAMRTGAVPMVAAKYLAPNAETIGLIGAGVIGTTCFICAKAVIPSIKNVKIKGSSPNSKTAIKLKKYINDNYPDCNVTICSTLEECVRDSDIINEAVSVAGQGETVKIESEWVKPGAVILSSMNLSFDDDFVIKSTKVIDNLTTYEGFYKDYLNASEKDKPTWKAYVGVNYQRLIKAGKFTKDDITWIGKMVEDNKSIRKSEDEVFIVGCIGMPIEDVGLGYAIYKNALDKGIGTKLNLWEKPFLA